uniref:Uncharacterized protein n=1 Tax=Siphoviridae sp. ctWsj12 TaxID=2826363 RepID=A0A8S5NRD5_9CAUD|nr:MAG TPA: hypothetical protein [Siphoviridae sp. ctWsj12]
MIISSSNKRNPLLHNLVIPIAHLNKHKERLNQKSSVVRLYFSRRLRKIRVLGSSNGRLPQAFICPSTLHCSLLL